MLNICLNHFVQVRESIGLVILTAPGIVGNLTRITAHGALDNMNLVIQLIAQIHLFGSDWPMLLGSSSISGITHLELHLTSIKKNIQHFFKQ